jgi:hypothetical protein
MIVGLYSEDVNLGLSKEGAEAPNTQPQLSFYYSAINKTMYSEL